MSSDSRFAISGMFAAIGIAAAVVGVVRLAASRSADVRATPAPHHIVVQAETNTVPQPARGDELRVCADPNNMPFSNERGEGFENRIAASVARALGRRVTYYWMPQRRGFIRNTLNAGLCDLVIGVPAGYDLVLTTRPYYASTYVFLTRHDRRRIASLDDEALRSLRIGIQITGDDYENPPGAQALAVRSLAPNVRGYTVYGDYSKADPQRAVVDAVARGDVDTAIVWGPLAAYFAAREPVAMDVTPVSPAVDRLSGPFTFAIAMGVRKNDRPLHDAVERAIAARRSDIALILREYAVPIVSATGTPAKAAR